MASPAREATCCYCGYTGLVKKVCNRSENGSHCSHWLGLSGPNDPCVQVIKIENRTPYGEGYPRGEFLSAAAVEHMCLGVGLEKMAASLVGGPRDAKARGVVNITGLGLFRVTIERSS